MNLEPHKPPVAPAREPNGWPTLSRAWIGRLRRLRHARGRQAEGLALVEGLRPIGSAILAGVRPAVIAAEPAWAADHAPLCDRWKSAASGPLPWCRVSAADLRRVATTQTSPGIVAAVPIENPAGRVSGNAALGPLREGIGLLLGVNDPGNLGSMLRAAWAAAVQAVWLLPGTVDPWNPKVVRAAAGAHWHVRWTWVRDPAEALAQAEVPPEAVWLADPHRGSAPWEAPRLPAHLLVIGHETAGLPLGLPGVPIRIPMPGGAESLNVAQATTVLLYELARSRYPHHDCGPARGDLDLSGPRA